MENYFEPVLSEEQMAAYLDGMLSTEKSHMVEELIENYPEMTEIQDVIDSVDSAYMYEINEEVPIECLADDFSLPEIGYDYHPEETYDTGEYVVDEDDVESNDNQDDSADLNYLDESQNMGEEDSLVDSEFVDISF